MTHGYTETLTHGNTVTWMFRKLKTTSSASRAEQCSIFECSKESTVLYIAALCVPSEGVES